MGFTKTLDNFFAGLYSFIQSKFSNSKPPFNPHEGGLDSQLNDIKDIENSIGDRFDKFYEKAVSKLNSYEKKVLNFFVNRALKY